MFRRLYWVSEQVAPNQTSAVLGVYTSIPDLIRYGLRFPDRGHLRLTLTKLDSDREPMARWISPEFEGLEEGLAPYIATEEFSVEQVKALLTEIKQKSEAPVA